MKVLFFIQSNCGGAERMAINIANFLDKGRYDITFYIIGSEIGSISKFIPATYDVKLIQAANFRDSVTRKIYIILKREMPDFVFSSTFPINVRLCNAAFLFPSIKVIIRSDNYLNYFSLSQRIRCFFSYTRARYIIVQTDEMYLEFVKAFFYKKKKIVMLSNPIDKDRIIGLTNGVANPFGDSGSEKVFLYVGRLSYSKGLDVLIKAFAIVCKKLPNARLYILGETSGVFNEYYNILQETVTSLDLEENISFLGFSANPYIYMKYCSCLVLPSRHEGLPNVVLESLYLGTPVAVSNCIPVINRIVHPNQNGFISKVGDVYGLADDMINSSNLGRVELLYSGASKQDFANLFI
jgi:glycosyltransferase involved in cell wall biosynthesis